LQHCLQAAESLFNERVIVVLGADAGQIQQGLQQTSATLVINPDWQDGMSGSIRTGVNALPADAQAVMILLCDQPLLDAGPLLELITLWQAQPEMIVASDYADSVGVPAIFPASVFSQLTSLTGDRGAKQILKSLSDKVISHPLQAAALDIDTQQDFENLMAHDKNSPGGVL
jgi:molybdenum cofactor cytidylyltransferase